MEMSTLLKAAQVESKNKNISLGMSIIGPTHFSVSISVISLSSLINESLENIVDI